MQTKDQQLAQVPVEQLAQQVMSALQTEEGQKQLAPLFQQFQSESQAMFKKGGKMDQAVKRLQPGGATSSNTDFLRTADVPSKNYNQRFAENGRLYWKDGNDWYRLSEGMEEPVRLDPEFDASEITRREQEAVDIPSNRSLNETRSRLGRWHQPKEVDGVKYDLKTMPTKVSRTQLLNDVMDNADFRNPNTWDKYGTDSVMMATDPSFYSRTASNRDWTVSAYRQRPAFRKVADMVGFKPSFIRWSETYNNKK